MSWVITVAALAIGVILGYVIRSMFSRNATNNSRNEELEQTKLEMSQHKQEVADHFDEHYQLLSQLTEQLNRVNQHWNESAQGLGQDAGKKSLQILSVAQVEETSELEAALADTDEATETAPEQPIEAENPTDECKENQVKEDEKTS